MFARVILFAFLICWPFAASAQVAVPPLSGRVVDQTATLSSSDIAALTQRLKDLETRKGSQVAVLIVASTQPEEIEQFSIRVADAWKAGRKGVDDGAILLIAKDDHRLRIEVGRGLEGAAGAYSRPGTRAGVFRPRSSPATCVTASPRV